jgi:hypothetical protein
MRDEDQGTPAPALGPKVMAAIGKELRGMYAEIIAEGVPERFAEILRRPANQREGDSVTLVLVGSRQIWAVALLAVLKSLQKQAPRCQNHRRSLNLSATAERDCDPPLLRIFPKAGSSSFPS